MPATPVIPGGELKKSTEEVVEPPKEMTYFRKRVGNFLHMMIRSRPVIYNLVQYLSRQITEVTKEHTNAIHRVMVYDFETQLQGWKLKPSRKWYCKENSF